MSEMSDALGELQDAQAESTDARPVCRIGKKWFTSAEALMETITASEVYVAGGTGKTGGFRVTISMDKFASEPKKFTQAQAHRGPALQILNVNQINGVSYEITCGDPSASQQ